MFRLNRKKEEGMPQVRGQPSNDGCKEEEDAKVPCSAGASGVDAQQLPPTRKKRSLMKRLSSNLSLLPRKHHKRKTSVPNPPSPTTNPASAAWEDAKRSELGTSSSSLFSSLRSKTTDSLCSKNFLSSGLDSSCMGNKQSRAPLGASAEEGDEVAKKGAVGGARVRLSSAPSASQDKPDDAVDEMPEDAIGSAENAVEAPVTLDFETTLRKGMLNLTVNDVEEADSDRPNTDEDNKSSDRDYAVTPTTPGMFSQDGGSGSEEPSLAPAGPAPNKHILRRAHIIKELLETERNYVKDLGLVVDGYMGQMRDPNCDTPMPEDLRGGKDKIVFGNLEAIYEWHRNSFLKSLELCADEPMKIGPLFQRCEHKLRLYVVYCENKNKSEYIVSEYLETYFEELRQKLGHKLQLPDLLIKPVQRITKYQLLLKDLYDVTEKAGLSEEAKILRKAVDLMRVIPKEANDMMLIGRIQGFDGRITAQGKLLHSGTLICQEGTSASSLSKPKDLEVFLFEQSMIFSEQTGKKTQFTLPGFVYRNHLKVNNMALVEKWGDDPLKFSVKSTDSRKELVYVCQVQTLEIREVWATKIRTMLDLQRNFLMALQSPIVYQKELTLKDS